jgi:hypothetical protein
MRNFARYMFPSFLLCALLSLAVAMGVHARASEHQPTAPAASMSPLDAARLHAARAELQRLDGLIAQIKQQAAPYQRSATDILARYAIEPADYFGNKVTVDDETGAITRQSVQRTPLVPPSKPAVDSSKTKESR